MHLTFDEAYLPVKLTAPSISDEEFAKFCDLYPDHLIELTAEGEIVIMTPNYSYTGSQSGEVYRQLGNWARGDRRGIATDPSIGFRLPDNALPSADAAWTLKSRVLKLKTPPRRGFWHLCPDFVVEVRSQTDRLRVLRAKMQEWIDNRAQLAWLVDPEREAVEVYRPGRDPETREGKENIAGEGPVEGFVLDLRLVWDPLAD